MGAPVFSFEFKNRLETGQLGETLGEYFLMVGLTQYREQFRYMISVDTTFGGAAIVDFGNNFNAISLTGEFHIYMSGMPPTTGGDGLLDTVANKAVEFAGDVLPFLGRTGAMEFHDFMGLLYFNRAGAESGSVYVPSGDTQASRINAGLIGKSRLSEYAIIFHDYQRNRHVEVVPQPDGISVTRGVDDTNTYKWEMNLLVIADANDWNKFSGDLLTSLLSYSPFYSIARTMAVLRSAIYLPLTLSGAALQLTRLWQTTISEAKGLVTDFENMKGLWRADGRAISQGWKGIKTSILHTMGKKDKLSLSERLEQAGDSVQSDVARARAAVADYQQKVTESIVRFDAILRNLTQVVIGPSGSLEQASQLPGADWSAVVQHDAYPIVTDAIWAQWQALGEAIKGEIDNQFSVVLSTAGDSWESLAEKYLSSRDQAGALAQYNAASSAQPPAGAIKIPFEYNTRVFAKMPANPGTADLERAILGEDLALTQSRDFDLAPNGDLGVVVGEACLGNNLVDLVDTPVGSLPGYQSYGNPMIPGETQAVWLKDAWLQKLVLAIRADPRVKSCTAVSQEVDGDVISHSLRIESIYEGISFWMDV